MNSEFLLTQKKAKYKFSLKNLFLWLSRVRPSIASRSKKKFSKWSYDNILIDWVWPGRTGKYLAGGLSASINKYIALLCGRSPKRLETTKLKDLIG